MQSYEEIKDIVSKIEHVKKEGYTSASSLPALEKCANFKNRPSDNNEASLKGSILHHILEHHLDEVLSGFITQPSDFPDEEWKKLMSIARQVSDLLNEGWVIDSQEAWHYSDEMGICGTIDLVMKLDKVYAILDFKTGRVIVDPSSAQICGYSAMVMEEKGLPMVYGGILQEGNEITPVEFKMDPAKARVKRILENTEVAINDNCQYCVHLATCEKMNELQENFMSGDKMNLQELRDAVPAIEARVKEIKRLSVERIGELEGYKLVTKKTKSIPAMVHRDLIDEVGLDKLIDSGAISIKVEKDIPEKYISVSESAPYTMKAGKKK